MGAVLVVMIVEATRRAALLLQPGPGRHRPDPCNNVPHAAHPEHCPARSALPRERVRTLVLWPVADLVARPGDLVAARLIGLVGHRASGKRGSGPIRSTLPQPKPKARNFAPTPRPSSLLSVRGWT